MPTARPGPQRCHWENKLRVLSGVLEVAEKEKREFLQVEYGRAWMK